MADSAPRARRRRAQRPSTAQNYDRSFDVPGGTGSQASGTSAGAGADELRIVSLDGNSEDEVTGEAFYRENMPPHFGTTQ